MGIFNDQQISEYYNGEFVGSIFGENNFINHTIFLTMWLIYILIKIYK